MAYEYDHDCPFEAFITNLGKYNEGELVGEWVKFPTTSEELQKVFERIGIGSKDDFGNPYEEWFISDYDCYVDGLYEKLGEYENLDELNYLASKLDELDDHDYNHFQAAMQISDYTGSIKDVINLIDNLDKYEIYPGVESNADLGHYYIEELGMMEVPDYLADYIDYEAYGRDVAINEPYEVEVEYEYKILNTTLTNNGISAAVSALNLTQDQMERYTLLMETRGNKPDIFGDNVYANPGVSEEYERYAVPGEYLTDQQFSNMHREAEKYLGYPYVWGGSSPGTSFDCSGFVSYVINNCGNGWNYGRLTANGWKNATARVAASDVKPGDLVFFQGTYNTAGASHVGIVVDPVNKIMIHCGNPIQYASYDTPYWRAHAYCYGRIQ